MSTTTGADFELIVGINHELSYNDMQKQMTDLISKLNGQSYMVRVGIQVDQASIDGFRTQITNISSMLQGLGSVTVNSVNTSGVAASVTNVSTAAATATQNLHTMTAALQAANTQKITNGLGSLNINPAAAEQLSASISNASVKVTEIRARLEGAGTEMQNLVNFTVMGENSTGQTVKYLVTYNQKTQEICKVVTDIAAKFKEVEGSAKRTSAAVQSTATSANKPEYFKMGNSKHLNMIDSARKYQDTINKNLQNWTLAKNGKSSGDYSTLQRNAEEVEKLAYQFENSKISVADFNKQMDRIKTSTVKANTAIRSAGENAKTLGDRVKGLAQKFTAWFGASQMVMYAYRTIRQMITNVVELDTAMTELRKVTNETDATYSRFLDNAASRAKRLGATLTDVVNASADFARLGFSLDKAETVADAALVYKNVGDGIKDINQASENIISAMQAFGIEADNVMSVVDKFNTIGNKFAISSGGVGDAILRSAAAMATANNTMDETVALIAAANTIVQDPEKVGTTLKTVSMYLRAAKTEAENAGESIEGMAESTSALRKKLLDLTKGQVDIQLDENTYKSTYQILEELSKVWSNLTDVTQANILESIGGKRNSNVVAAILENFDIASRAVKESANSAGSALEENEKVLESIQGKFSQLKASFQELSSNLFNNTFIKIILDIGKALLEILNSLGGIPGIILAITASTGVLIGTIKTLSNIAWVQNIRTAFASLAGRITTTILFEYARHTLMVTLNELIKKTVLSTKVYEVNNYKWCA